MEDLSIQGRRDFPTARPTAARTEKPAAAASEQIRSPIPSETSEHLTAGPNSGEDRFRQSRLILQTGESVLTEITDSLSRMNELLRQSGTKDRNALSGDLARLGIEVDRLINSAAVGETQLFQRGDRTEFFLPLWLQNGIAQGTQDPAVLLAALGLTGTPEASELINAVLDHALGTNSATDHLAVLYLGALIAGDGKIPDTLDREAILDGIRQLLEMVNGGETVDRAIAELTGGTFTSLSAFEAAFGDGTAPDLMEFLSGVLLGQEEPVLPVLPTLPELLDGLDLLGGTELDLLLMMAGSTEPLPVSPNSVDGAAQSPPPEDSASAAAPETVPVPADVPPASLNGNDAPPAVLHAGGLTVSGRDLSGVSVQDGVVTLTGQGDFTIRGAQPDTVVQLNGSGAVTLENARIGTLTAASPGTRIVTVGESVVEHLTLKAGASLTADGGGRVLVSHFHTAANGVVRLNGGTILVNGNGGTIPARVEINGPAILPAGTIPQTKDGGASTSLDLIWKTLLPGAERLLGVSVDGVHACMFMGTGSTARLWLDRGPDGSHGYPDRLVTLTGRDGEGRRKTRSLFLHWDGDLAQYQEAPLYPNPFQVSGGVEGEDWVYDPLTRVLRILTARAMTVSGGPGLDARRDPFSGRVVLADGLGSTTLTLDGANCQVSFGRAFDLGRENQVTLLLRGDNCFQSGVGCAGLSLGDGTSVLIDTLPEGSGTLTASGGYGGAGIGRDRSAGPDRQCRVSIRSGTVTARTFGAGAGIGAGRDGAVGAISIAGGTVFAAGGRSGGAAIGGAPGGPAGDITILGGEITVSAPSVSEAIGPGAGSVCGEVRIARAARIVYKDGKPDTGESKKSKGIPLELGEETVILPRFRLSAEGLRIQDIDVSSPENLLEAQRTVSEASRRVWRIHLAYQEMFGRLEEHLYSLWNVHSSLAVPVRSDGAARALLTGVKEAIAARPGQVVDGRQESVAGEIFRLLHQK